MRVTKSFTKADCKDNKKILIYGAGRYGELALHGLKAINVKPVAFVDERLTGEDYCGYPVISPLELENYVNDIVLIASYNYFFEMVSNLQAIGYDEIYDILELIKMNYDESVLSEYLLDEKHNWHKYANVVENIDTNKLVINHCELVVTECCSLKCRDCANMMQYYKTPANLDTDEMITSFNRFMDSIDVLLELRILGGEPFVKNDLDQIINAFVDNEKIKRVTIYTNSTIVPSDRIISVLKNSKISIHMSNYGKPSRNIEKLASVLKENGVSHYIHNYEKWYDLGDTECRNFSVKDMKLIYKSCMMAKCYTFYRGKLFICPRSAHGEQLGIFKNARWEFVDFTQESKTEDKKKEINYLLDNIQFLTACNYCNGSSSKSREIEAAVQVR